MPFCEHCPAAGGYCSVCLAREAESLPPCYCRWAIPRDLPRLARIEDETCGDWTEETFKKRNSCRTVVTFVAEDTQGNGPVRGFVVFKIWRYTLEVLNLAAVDPVARRALINALRSQAEKRGRQIVWPAAVV